MPTAQPSERTELVRRIRLLLHEQRNDEAVRAVDDLPTKLRADPELLFLRAVALERCTRFGDVIDTARRSIRARERPETLLVLARCQRAIGDAEACLETLDRVEMLGPGTESAAILRGGALEAAGRFEEVAGVLEPLVERYRSAGKPPPLALDVEWSRLLVQRNRLGEAVALIDATLENPEMPPPLQAQQLCLKAKALDRGRDDEGAAAAAALANGIGKVDFDPDLYTEQADALISNWSRENIATFPVSTCDSHIPVFVAGMPRSGTSLIDQIIDAHACQECSGFGFPEKQGGLSTPRPPRRLVRQHGTRRAVVDPELQRPNVRVQRPLRPRSPSPPPGKVVAQQSNSTKG